MKRKKSLVFSVMILILVSLSACDALGLGGESPTAEPVSESPPTPTEELVPPTLLPTADAGQAIVESLEILTSESAPPGYNARVRGVFSDGCTTIEGIDSALEGDTFNLSIITGQLPNNECSQDAGDFDEIILLDTTGLPARTYEVTAGEMRGSFILQTESEATATPSVTGGSISGTIWQDICSPEETDGQEPPAGCVTEEDGTLSADGLLIDEEGIAGVQVGIAEGACPAVAFSAAEANAAGEYTFTGLDAGTYCVFVPMNVEQNEILLADGIWTAPEGGVPQSTVTLEDGATETAVDFGWDYQPLAPVEVDLTDCENSLEFVEDITIPDDTIVPPGGEFTKTWLLGNNGTCPWRVEYSIVFVGGELMSTDEPLPLESEVPPGEEIRVSVDMVAPDEPGTYRGNYQIADVEGQPFGIDGNVEDAFWLRIVVEEGAEAPATPLPNSAAIGGVVWEDLCVNSNPGGNCVEFPEGSGAFIGNGTFNANEPALSGIRMVLAEGVCPTDGTFPADDATLDEQLTGDDGRYLFENLADDTYCVYMDALAEATLDLLIPGNWTWPATGVGLYTFILDPGEQALDLDFGWDYQE